MSRTQHSVRDHSPGCHVVAGVALRDDTLASDDGTSGLAIKQSQPGVDVPRADLDLIAAGEKYYIWDSGEADVAIPGGLVVAKGDRLWIDPATNAVVVNNADVLPGGAGGPPAGSQRLGKVRYLAPERGLSTGLMTVGFDARKDF